MKLCSVEGCERDTLARGWCGKHYSRWQKHGDPNVVHCRLKGEPQSPVVKSTLIRGQLVRFTADGRTFVDVKRKRGLEVRTERRYGALFICAHCGKEAFCKSSGLNRFEYCGHDCAAAATGLQKVGRTRSSTSKKGAAGHLDRLFSALVRTAGRCVNCGADTHLQCAHGFSRRYRNVRWDTRNAFCLCQKCHLYYTHRPLEWDEWLRTRWGDGLYAELRRLALRVDIKPDFDAVRESLAGEVRRRGLTLRHLPKTVTGWAGLAGEGAA